MEEPSVLDYLKSRLPWSKQKEELPILSPEGGEPPEPGPAFNLTLNLPWRTLLALALALIGQFVLDPTGLSFGVQQGSSLRQSDFQTALYIGLGFYVIALGFLLWAYFVNEFSLPSLPEGEPVIDPQTARRRWIIVAMVLTFIAFLAFGTNPIQAFLTPDADPPPSFFFNKNIFTPLNVSLWLAGLALFLGGLWLHRTSQPAASLDENEALVKAPHPSPSPDPASRWWDVGLLLFLAVCGALGLGGNIYLFGLLPLLIACMIIWLRNPNAALTPAQQIKAVFARDSWQINLSRWTLLVLAVSALVIFFRF